MWDSFTNPLPLALMLLARPEWWPVAAAAEITLRAAAGWATAGHVLRDALTGRLFLLAPLQDLLSFGHVGPEDFLGIRSCGAEGNIICRRMEGSNW